mgnify:CR=1 FL=1
MADFWQQVKHCSEAAIASGNAQPIDTDAQYTEEFHQQFCIRLIDPLWQKPTVSEHKPGFNPFLSPDPALTVREVSDSHLCVLNKYPVLSQHVLLITQEFKPQQARLNIDDFIALADVMAQGESFGFYNSGPEAGASQSHKHLQLIQLTEQNQQLMPLLPVLQKFRDGVPQQLPELPYYHAGVALSKDLLKKSELAPVEMQMQYEKLCRHLKLHSDHNEFIQQPYNLLVTSQWMMMIPRRQECHQGVSVNGLGFVGSLLVKDQQQLSTLLESGPGSLLQAVTRAREDITSEG